jgi:hypothetical protein
MGTVVSLAEGGRAIIARERLCARVQKQMSLKTARISERLATDETNIIPANEALAHEHVVEVAIVTQNTFLAVFAGEYSFSWMHIDMRNQGLKGRVDDTTFRARRKQMTFTVHVLV